MGFKKTSTGELLFEFTNTPAELLPIKANEDLLSKYGCNLPSCQMDHFFLVKHSDGTFAEIAVQIRGDAHKEYGFALVLALEEPDETWGVTANVPVVATLAKLMKDYESKCTDDSIAPYDTSRLWDKGVAFPIMPMLDAKEYIESNNIPNDGYANLKSRIGG